ncbi:uncharacterized protein [Nicotiana sylvestris]|uniref:uncharacterized protein n=1 Tax=Nicotiana sylvestris TaxID=4096 RepID=UPI00388CDA8B
MEPLKRRKNIKRILRKLIQGSRQWHEKLPFALLGYRTTVRTSVGATPYLLVYGTEAVIPAEVEIPSIRIIVESEIEDTEWVKTRLEQLMLIDEKRLVAVCFKQLYQQRMARTYNKKVRLRQFEVGQLVLKCIPPHQVEAKGKFAPNWQGPYIVKKVLPKGALHLVDEEGRALPYSTSESLQFQFLIRRKKSFDHKIVGVSFDNVSATQLLKIHLLKF